MCVRNKLIAGLYPMVSACGLLVCHELCGTTATCGRQVLEAMAQSPSQAVRRRFFQLRVMDYVTRELSLEMELAAADPLKGRGSGASAAQSGRSSGLPTPSSLQVPSHCWRLLTLDASGCAHGLLRFVRHWAQWICHALLPAQRMTVHKCGRVMRNTIWRLLAPHCRNLRRRECPAERQRDPPRLGHPGGARRGPQATAGRRAPVGEAWMAAATPVQRRLAVHVPMAK